MSREIMQQALDLLKSAYVSTALIWDRADCVESLEAALAQLEQEPVNIHCPSCLHSFSIAPVAKREWVGLTSEDWENTPDTGKQGCERDAELFDWIEKTLKDKNDTF